MRVRIGQTFRVTPLCHGHSNGQAALRLSSQGSVQVVDTTCPQAVMTLSGQGWDVGPGSWWGGGCLRGGDQEGVPGGGAVELQPGGCIG